MQPEKNETDFDVEFPLDWWFDQQRDHANQWDVSGIWPDSRQEPQDHAPGSVDE